MFSVTSNLSIAAVSRTDIFLTAFVPATSCSDQKHLECKENMYVHVCAEHRQGEKQSRLIIKKVLEAIKYFLYSSKWFFFLILGDYLLLY